MQSWIKHPCKKSSSSEHSIIYFFNKFFFTFLRNSKSFLWFLINYFIITLTSRWKEIFFWLPEIEHHLSFTSFVNMWFIIFLINAKKAKDVPLKTTFSKSFESRQWSGYFLPNAPDLCVVALWTCMWRLSFRTLIKCTNETKIITRRFQYESEVLSSFRNIYLSGEREREKSSMRKGGRVQNTIANKIEFMLLFQ